MAQPSRRDMTAHSTSPTRKARTPATRRALKRAAVGAAARSVVEQLEGRQLMAAQPTAQLIDANTDRVIATMTDGMTVDLGKTGSALNINALPAGPAGSVVFKLDGRPVITETYAPFAIGADTKGDFNAWTPPAGSHTLQVLQYSRAGGAGSIVASRTLKFTVVGRASAPAPAPLPAPGPVPTNVPSSTGAVRGGGAAAVLQVVGARSGVAGMPVVVSAVDSRLPNGALHARFNWDFGDAGGAYNRLTGWTAGHVYDRPGTYTIRLTVTDANGSSSAAATTINVTGDNRRVVHVDAVAGRDSNPGTLGAPIKSFNRARQFATNNVKILFKRGQAWQTNGWMSITGDNVHVGAYGSGANPVLSVVSGKTAIQTFRGSEHTVVENITFDSPYRPRGHDADKTGVSGLFVGGSNVAVRNCTFLNVDDGVNANQQPRGFIFQDNDAPLTTGIRGYMVWVEGSDIVLLGNRVANSTREHNFRIKDGNRLLIAHNDLANISRRHVDGQDDTKGTIEMQRGSWAYIYGNTTRDGPVRVGPPRRGDRAGQHPVVVHGHREQPDQQLPAERDGRGPAPVDPEQRVLRERAGRPSRSTRRTPGAGTWPTSTSTGTRRSTRPRPAGSCGSRAGCRPDDQPRPQPVRGRQPRHRGGQHGRRQRVGRQPRRVPDGREQRLAGPAVDHQVRPGRRDVGGRQLQRAGRVQGPPRVALVPRGPGRRVPELTRARPGAGGDLPVMWGEAAFRSPFRTRRDRHAQPDNDPGPPARRPRAGGPFRSPPHRSGATPHDRPCFPTFRSGAT
jgi:PKD repeat protein